MSQPRPVSQIRQEFIDFFVERARHTFIASSPVVPHDDPTLLFTNAGMNQFKPLFLGNVSPSSPLFGLKRAVNTQKCIRAGGKHNDLDDVGKDGYHHTFFEMLGNWSFGDYFKAESVQWGWELLTNVWGIDPERLFATYFEGNKELGLEPDREAYEIWRQYLPADRILPGNMKDNFWEMGDTGPCGPCSEIHYDGRSAEVRARVPGSGLVNTGDPNVIEIWNHVFIQFNRTGPGPDGLRALPAKHVDTGMGLERITRVVQGKTSNYDTDAFTPIFRDIERVCKSPPYGGSWTEPKDTAYRVIADHLRTLAFAITDGADPSNEGRGYVLRRILRRAVRFGRQTLGVPGAFLCDLVPTVVEQMGGAFPELTKNPKRVYDVIRDEEEAFGRTLNQGIVLFDRAAAAKGISAGDAFRLHDTYGFPIDLTQLMAEERGLKVDVEGFHRHMEEARQKARAASKATEEGAGTLTTDAIASLKRMRIEPTDDAEKFTGKRMRAGIVAIWNGHTFDEHLVARNTRPEDRFAVILDRTSFYAEMGGQAADKGRMQVTRERRSSASDAHEGGEFHVEDVRTVGGYMLHVGRIHRGEVRVGDDVELRVDQPRRKQIAANHTATHLVNWALRDALGDHVDQKGSLVAADRLRFDFSHPQAMTTEQAHRVEQSVRRMITANLPVFAEAIPLAAGRRIHGVRAVFGETYPDPVRLVSIGVKADEMLGDPENARWRGYSAEFCGGTHLATTGEADAFALMSEEGVAKGVRRVTAVTGEAAVESLALAERLKSRISGAASLDMKHLVPEVQSLAQEIEAAAIPLTRRHELKAMLAPLIEKSKSAQKEAAGAERGRTVAAARDLAERAAGPAIILELPAGADRDGLLAAMDAVRSRHPASAVMLLAAGTDGKGTIVANVPPALIEKGLKAGDWVREASAPLGGKGGGRPESAQGGGPDATKIAQAIAAARAYAATKVA
jgi:alanyl-tRNA synthetase